MEGYDAMAICHKVHLQALSGVKIFQRAEWYLRGFNITASALKSLS